MNLILVDLVSGARFVEALAERVGTADVSVSLRLGDDRFVLTPQDDVTHLVLSQRSSTRSLMRSEHRWQPSAIVESMVQTNLLNRYSSTTSCSQVFQRSFPWHLCTHGSEGDDTNGDTNHGKVYPRR